MSAPAEDEELRRQQELAALAAYGTRGWATRGWWQVFLLIAALAACLGAVVFLRPFFQNAAISSRPMSRVTIQSPQHAFRSGQTDGTLYYVDQASDLATTDIFTRAITVTQAVALNLTNSPDYSELLPALAPSDNRLAYIAVSKGGDRSVRVLQAGSAPVDLTSRLEKGCQVDLGGPPLWNSDGAWIAFFAECNRPSGKIVQLFAARADGSAITELSARDYQVTEARWLDATTMIFAERHGETAGAIYYVPLAHPTPAPLGAVTVPK